ncbi:MaoC family dehydratase [Microvirga antarctica]|uniref:MaoC family dehydratase n=1 Tax=Microvirga antarctica TaxID=2819233 RepID=UPI001B30030E|nr:MaoC family dehydratase [Microvirga antarctica]
MTRYAFEDFTPGLTLTMGPVSVSKDEIIAFATEFDPQPFHIDEIAAKDTFVGTLIASGWHTCALNMRLFADNVLLDSTGMGAPGIEGLQWLRPVKPGDTLRSRMRVTDQRPSKSRPTIGLVQFHFEMVNQRDEPVLTQSNWVMFARRDAPAVEGAPAKDRIANTEPPIPEIKASLSTNPYLDDLVVGETMELGSFTFSPDDIIRFARQFDPQLFHLDAEAARHSLFGGLCASGWHTAGVWMKLMAAHRDRVRKDAIARGLRIARLGPSPGFTNLKWHKPVYAGDTISYRTTLTGKRNSASRPGWGIASHHNEGTNQYGEPVLAFDGAVFWERRPTD